MKDIRNAALIAGLVFSIAVGAQGAVVKKALKKPVAAPSSAPKVSPVAKKKLSKDISFNGAQVDGKYLSAGESVAEVEGDKEMGALIGIRKNFRDRLGAETARLEASTGKAATQSGKGN
jgi:hypothetical protein